MAYHKEEKKETKEVVSIVKEWYTCDFCGDKLERDTFLSKTGMIEWKVREVFPGDGREYSQTVDFCEKCYNVVVLPWLGSLQIAPRVQILNW